MKKIAFSEKYGLHQATVEGWKTMTRRMDARTAKPLYQVGELVAVAQRYEDIYDELVKKYDKVQANGWWCDARRILGCNPVEVPGYSNKMFVRADLMIHHIRITNIKWEMLRDISDEDCMKEGITKGKFKDFPREMFFPYTGCKDEEVCYTPKAAFSVLIDKVSGKGTWDENPWVWVYEYEKLN